MSIRETVKRRGYAMVDVASLQPNPLNPRTRFDETALKELADSVAVFGVLEPLLVTPELVVVAGERRRRAAIAAGVEQVPVVIEERPTREQLEIMLTENLLRENLSPIDEAKTIQRLLEECGLTQEELGKRLGKSQPWISNRLRLLRLPSPVVEQVRSGELSAGHAQVLLRYEGAPELVERAAKRIIKNGVPVTAVERDAIGVEANSVPRSPKSEYRTLGTYNQKFNSRGCSKCEHYRATGYQKLCLNPECYDRKQAEAEAQQVEKTGGLTCEKLRQDGIAYVDAWSFQQGRDGECDACEKRRTVLDYGDREVEVCIDRECWQRKQAVKEQARRSAARAAMDAELAQIHTVAEEAKDGLQPQHLALLLMELLRVETYNRRHHEADKEWPDHDQLLGSRFGRQWPFKYSWSGLDLGDEEHADKARELAEHLATRKPGQLRAALVEWVLLCGIGHLGPVLELLGAEPCSDEAVAEPIKESDSEASPEQPQFSPSPTRRAPPWPQECPAWESCSHWGGPKMGCAAPADVSVCPFTPDDNDDACPKMDCDYWNHGECAAPIDHPCPLDDAGLEPRWSGDEEDEPGPDTLEDLIKTDPPGEV